MELGWDSVYLAELASANEHLEEQAKVVEDAERCRMQSESEDTLESSSPKITIWWARRLVDTLGELGYDVKTARSKQQDVSIISGCTGCSAESAVMEALNSTVKMMALYFFHLFPVSCNFFK